MSGLTYTANVTHQTLTNAAQDLLEGLTSADTPITIHRIEISFATINQANTYFQLLIRSSAGSGGSAVTAAATQRRNTIGADTAFQRQVTTPGTAGAVLNGWDWNVVAPFDTVFGKPDLEIEIPAATRFALNLSAAVGTIAYSATITFTER
jgi:hypothetical protein